MWGTILAVYTLAFGVKGLQLAFSGGVYWITPLFNGVALVLAVALASRTGLIGLRRAQRRRSDPPDMPGDAAPADGLPGRNSESEDVEPASDEVFR